LTCRELFKQSVLSVNTEEMLSQLPAGITHLYTRIMDQVLASGNERSTVHIKVILQARPFMLPELAVAAGLPKQYHHNVHVLGEYVEQCGSMVTVRERQAHFVHLSAKTYFRQAQFIHLTARIHILENGRESVVFHDLRAEHRNIAVHCFQYVCNELQRSLHLRDSSPSISKIRKTSDAVKRKKGDIALLEYPMLFWMGSCQRRLR